MTVLLRTAVAALACALLAPAHAEPKADFALLHALSKVSENRLVGVWESQVDLGPCTGSGPRRQFRGLNVFNLGGTMVDTNGAAPSTRGPGFGSWLYDAPSKTYRIRMLFYRYLPDGTFDGLSDIHREATLADDAQSFTDEIYARLLNPDNTLRAELCGSSAATRLGVE